MLFVFFVAEKAIEAVKHNDKVKTDPVRIAYSEELNHNGTTATTKNFDGITGLAGSTRLKSKKAIRSKSCHLHAVAVVSLWLKDRENRSTTCATIAQKRPLKNPAAD